MVGGQWQLRKVILCLCCGLWLSVWKEHRNRMCNQYSFMMRFWPHNHTVMSLVCEVSFRQGSVCVCVDVWTWYILIKSKRFRELLSVWACQASGRFSFSQPSDYFPSISLYPFYIYIKISKWTQTRDIYFRSCRLCSKTQNFGFGAPWTQDSSWSFVLHKIAFWSQEMNMPILVQIGLSVIQRIAYIHTISIWYNWRELLLCHVVLPKQIWILA